MSLVTAKRTNPKLWESVKRQVIRGSKGGPPGKWSARKAQLSVKLYKSKGGKYSGKKDPRNSLTKWSKEDWGYVGSGRRGKGGKKSKSRSGRYLPRIVRQHLSPKARRSENRAKGRKSGKWIPYGSEVKSLMHKYKIITPQRKRSSKKHSRSRK
jgi:hypothetical protein